MKLGLNLTENDRIEASFRRTYSETEYDGSSYDFLTNRYQSIDAENYESGFFGITPYFEKIDNRFYSAQYTHKDDLNDLSLRYNYSSFKRTVSDFEGNTQETLLQDRLNYMEDSFLRLGASYQRFEHERNFGDSFHHNYNDRALFATNYNKVLLFESLGNTIFTQSLRFDDYSAFENKTTGKVGLKQFVYEDIYLSSNYGTAYNVPSLYQLYAPGFPDFFNPGSIIPVGNQNLSPEDTRTIDVSIGNDEFTLTYFYNKIDNLIEYDFALGYQNVAGRSRIKGVEVGYKDDFFDMFTVNFNYTYLNAKNSDGEFLRSRPKHQIDGNVFYYITESLNIGINGQYIGERYDDDDRRGAQTGKYTVFNAVANYTLNENFSFYMKLDNITDKYYHVRDGYATSERAFYAGLTAKF
jgi:vitamin B12 transporter